ncbi:phiSA1p31-related protein, partial [Streptomyces roseolus]|uniref:phiSA1p31-related protein n=1 Tax=Streptomyces roseolus TaxID=67358 RepID=UPI003665790B
DKAAHEGFGDVEITYGPYTNSYGSSRFLARREDGREVAVDPASMTPLPKFAVGDMVEYMYGGSGKLVAGPFKSRYHEEDIWVVEQADGTHMIPTANALMKVEPEPEPEPARNIRVGDRVRIVRATHAEECHGRCGVVESTTETFRQWDGDLHRYSVRLDDDDTVYVAEVELLDDTADTYTHDGVTYDLSARYRDRDGDVWHFKRFGDDVRAGIRRDPLSADDGDPIEVAHSYGPLTRDTS